LSYPEGSWFNTRRQNGPIPLVDMKSVTMRILHIYKDYFPVLGGIENHVRDLAEAQADAGHDVTVLYAAPGFRSRIDRLNGVRLVAAGRLTTLASVPLSPALFLKAARLRADVTHLHFPHPPGEVASLICRPAPRTVITYHCDVVRQQGWLRLYRPLLRRVLRNTHRIIVTSEAYVNTSPYLKPFRDKCILVPLGADLARFQDIPTGRIAAVRSRYDLPDDTPLLLFVGRHRYYKGVDDLIKALPDISRARLVIVGEGPMSRSWRELADQLQLQSRIVFTGEVSQDDLAALYGAATLFVLPSNSRAEAYGTVLIEAMAAGVPMITTELGEYGQKML